MKEILGFLIFLYIILFFIGYIPLRIKGREKTKQYCENVMKEADRHLLLIATLGAGDANACLHMGYLPLKKSEEINNGTIETK